MEESDLENRLRAVEESITALSNQVEGLQTSSDARYRVWSKNSCGFACVVFQEPAKPLTTLHRACTLVVLADRRKEQDIAFALMIPLVMKMPHILRQRMAE